MCVAPHELLILLHWAWARKGNARNALCGIIPFAFSSLIALMPIMLLCTFLYLEAMPYIQYCLVGSSF